MSDDQRAHKGLAEEMTDQEIRGFLATKLMGWTYDEKQRVYLDPNTDAKDGIARVEGIVVTPYGVTPRNSFWVCDMWDPIDDANHCRACVKKIGELGLGEHYANKLVILQDKKNLALIDEPWKINELNLFNLLTLPLKTQCEAIVEVLKERDNA